MTLLTSKNDPLGLALVIAISLHALFILGVGFDFKPEATKPHLSSNLEITVVNQLASSPLADENPSFAAQISQQGGGTQNKKIKPTLKNTAAPVRNENATRELPPLTKQQPADKITKKAKTHSSESRKKAIREKTLAVERQTGKKSLSDEVQPKPKKTITAAQILATRNNEIERMTTQVITRSNAYAKRERRKAISASTKEYKYAAYLDAWRRKVERIGNLNYPLAASRDKLYGNLVLHVALRADGNIENIRLVYSSGHKVLDDAAIRIVRLAAPFAPFPENIRQETDILDITRTWQFQSSNRLGWGK